MRRFWTPPEIERLAVLYRDHTAGECAAELGRSVRAVYQAVDLHGLKKARRAVIDGHFLAAIMRLNREGLSDTEIADRIDCERHTVTKYRGRLGRPSNARGERYRGRVRENTRRQCERMGVDSVGELRSLVFRIRSLEAGWPVDLRPRHVEILGLLESRGPMARREIADALGMPWHGSRASLKSSDPEGSYLAHLIRIGLVIDLGRIGRITGEGKGKSCHIYALAIGAERKEA